MATLAGIHALTDPTDNGRGIRITALHGAGAAAAAVLQGNVLGVGKQVQMVLDLTGSDADANTAIRAAFGVA